MAAENVGRRRWLSGILPTAADAVVSTVEARLESFPPQRRPPGAVSEGRFLRLCTRCDECVEACPHGAVLKFTDAAPPPLAGTPVLRPDRRACHMCEGYPCAAACPEGALAPPEVTPWPLGRVAIARDRCIAYMGPECGACVGVCPEGLAAIRLVAWRPVVDADRCVGCGLCIEACPTRPAAIELEPL